MPQLIIAVAAFVSSHFLMSHPMRAPLAKTLGANGFQIVYSLVSLVTFGWAIWAFTKAPDSAPLWIAGDALWAVASLIMLIGSILFAGSIIGNPALPRPDAAGLTHTAPRGALAITRHPMMWGFAAWAITHLLVSPQPKVIILTAGVGLLALGGSRGQDRKKTQLMGDAWIGWMAQTRFIPFSGQVSGQISWASAVPGRTVILAGSALWLLATWAHPWLGAPTAGLWRWLG